MPSTGIAAFKIARQPHKNRRQAHKRMENGHQLRHGRHGDAGCKNTADNKAQNDGAPKHSRSLVEIEVLMLQYGVTKTATMAKTMPTMP